ncbi:sigma 54-interacting transcriptional regulator, partial [Cupriavidus metallidurans]|uniref:sigma 54-interacting transcriptional regulator n=1 Tax=Cupriavidus metallidurans TaxID=119219 RepID=UPI00055D17E9
MIAEETAEFGILVVDADDNLAYASGVATLGSIQAALMANLADKRGSRSGMFAIEAMQSAVAIYRVQGRSVVFLIQPSASRSELFDFVASVDFADAILNQLLESPYSGMVVVDSEARLRYLAPAHRKFLGVSRGTGVGRHVTETVTQSKLQDVLKSGKAEFGKLWADNDETRVVSRTPIRKDGEVVGAIGQLMFKAPERVHHLSQEVAELRKEVAFYRRELSAGAGQDRQFEQMIGNSDAIRQLKSDLLKVAPLEVPVLIIGESGTGKELAAQALHALSPRSEKRMVVVNAAAIPGSLVEAELFGFESGSFTGAEKGGRRGKFELA